MLKTKLHQAILIVVLKEMQVAFKQLFQSTSNREFRRWKDFLAS
jgi:hypothetical protein